MTLLTDLVAALASGDVRVVDLTQPLSERTPILQLPEPFANTPGLSRREISRYDDRYVKRDGQWLFQRRSYRFIYNGPPDLGGEYTRPA